MLNNCITDLIRAVKQKNDPDFAIAHFSRPSLKAQISNEDYRKVFEDIQNWANKVRIAKATIANLKACGVDAAIIKRIEGSFLRGELL